MAREWLGRGVSCWKRIKRKRRTEDGRETTINNRGFSLIELLIAIAVLAVVGTMLMQLLSTATGLYRKTLFTSQLQKSSQMISRRLETAIMNAKSLYYQTDDDENAFLYMGGDMAGQNHTVFHGAFLLFDAGKNTVYYCDQKSVPASESGLLTMDAVKSALEGESGTDKDYLLSTNVSGLTFELPYGTETAGENTQSADGSQTYSTENSPVVTYHLSLRHVSGITYAITNTAVPRNHLQQIRWPVKAIAAKPEKETT